MPLALVPFKLHGYLVVDIGTGERKRFIRMAFVRYGSSIHQIVQTAAALYRIRGILQALKESFAPPRGHVLVALCALVACVLVCRMQLWPCSVDQSADEESGV